MDADLEERQRMVSEEYRTESLRVVNGGGYFSPRLHDLLEEQSEILDEHFRRENRRIILMMVFVTIGALAWTLLALLKGMH